LSRVLRGIAREKGVQRSSAAVALSPSDLRKVLAWLDGSGLLRTDRLVLAAAFAVAFACCLHTGEWAPRTFDPSLHFTVACVDRSGRALSLLLPSSKTDQFRRGTPIPVPQSSDHVVCAQTRLLAYLDHAPAVPTAPLFRLASGRHLDSVSANRWLREALIGVGINPAGYSGYSFRRGAATAAAAAGAPDRDIMALGRWRSSVFTRYIDHDKQ
jgi:integrase